MNDGERAKRRCEQQVARALMVIFKSPKYARECEEQQAQRGEPVAFPPSTFGLGIMMMLEPPRRDGHEKWKATMRCTVDHLRAAEATAMAAGDPELVGRIMFYRHTKYGCGHPDGPLGELGLA